MICNYFKDNSRKIESRKKDIEFMVLIGVDGIPMTNCGTGIGEYEPTINETENYCFKDFKDCPRFQTRIKK
jgi:hypothetical protein